MDKSHFFVALIMLAIITTGIIYQVHLDIKSLSINPLKGIGDACVHLTPLASIILAYYLGSKSSNNDK